MRKVALYEPGRTHGKLVLFDFNDHKSSDPDSVGIRCNTASGAFVLLNVAIIRTD
jgi:hypothetical protein